MESLRFISLMILWAVVLVNLALTLRIINWLQTIEDLHRQRSKGHILRQLSVGAAAPDFVAKTLSDQSVGLATYAGQAVAFIFVSAHCGSCRQHLPMLVKLSAKAKQRAGVELVIVSESSAVETRTWINAIREEDGVEVTLPILVAPRMSSDFVKDYNPQGMVPYYCFISAEGIVQARDRLGLGAWSQLQREWEGPVTTRSSSRLYT